MLKVNLDETVIEIEVNAQPRADKQEFEEWLEKKMDWNRSRYKEAKIKALLMEKGLTPEELKDELISHDIKKADILSTNKKNASDGKIEIEESKELVINNKVWLKIEPEITENEYKRRF